MRVWHSGRASAFQAEYRGSIPRIRSSQPGKRCVKKFVFAFILLAGGFFSNASAELIDLPETGECISITNQPVQYIPLSTNEFKKLFPNYMFGMSLPGPLVVIDAQTLGLTPPEFQELVFWHECGHHALGHIPPSSAFNQPDSGSKREKDADCYAAKRVKKYRGFKPINMLKATEAMRIIGMPQERIAITWECAARP